MIVDNLNPKPQNKIQFKRAFYKSVPSESGCYILSNFGGDILYIGLAINLNKRFIQHLESTEKISRTVNGKAVWFYYNLYDSKNLPKLERTWINQFTSQNGKLPILNKVNSPIT